MVTIPVKLYTATESKDVRFRLLHRADGAPIEEKRFCTEDGMEVAWEDLVRGFEVAKGEFVVLEPEEIDAAKPESSTSIEIGDFVETEEIDPIYFEKSYFLEPTEVGGKPSSLLKRALEEADGVALARVTIRTPTRARPCSPRPRPPPGRKGRRSRRAARARRPLAPPSPARGRPDRPSRGAHRGRMARRSRRE
jgi:Ku protein